MKSILSLKGLIRISAIFLFFSMIMLPFSGQAQINHPLTAPVLNELYHFNFEAADSLINHLDSAENAVQFNFLKTHYYRWFYLPIHQQDEKVLKIYQSYLSAQNKNLPEQQAIYIRMNNALLQAEFHYNQSNYYKSFQYGSDVYEVVKNYLSEPAEELEIRFLAALYHYYYQYYVNENPVFGAVMWFFKTGDKPTGLKWLKEVANSENIVATEALIYLSHIYLRLENQVDTAYTYATSLHQMYPGNLKFYELQIETALATKQLDSNIEQLVERLLQSDQVYFQKYGKCYEALVQVQKEGSSVAENVKAVKAAISFIEDNGGGKHLLSLLNQALFDLTNDKAYLKQKVSLEVYRYTLTGYSRVDESLEN